MSKITIIPNSKKVNIDGVSYTDLDLSFIDPSIHAIQWKDSIGEIERRDLVTEKIIANEELLDISPYQKAIDLWNEADLAFKQEQSLQEKINIFE
jgi:hypothetical protein